MPIHTSRIAGTTWYRGGSQDGPQAAMFNAAPNQGAKCFIKLERASWDDKPHAVNTYGAYEIHERFVQALDDMPGNGRHFYEILRNDRPQRLFIDYDLLSADAAAQVRETVQDMIDYVNNELSKIITEHDATTVVTCSSRPGPDGATKHSYHVVWPNVWFQTVDRGMKAFMHGHETIHFDRNVYTKNRCMRTIYSSKFGSSVTLVPIDLATGATLHDVLVTDYLISYPPPPNQAVVLDTAVLSRPKPQKKKSTKKSIQTMKADPAPDLDKVAAPDLDKVAAALERFGYRDVVWLEPYKDGWRFAWDISYPDPLDLPSRLVYHSQNNHALVTWNQDQDRVYVTTFSASVQRKSAPIMTISGRPLIDSWTGACPMTVIKELIERGDLHQAKIIISQTMAVSLTEDVVFTRRDQSGQLCWHREKLKAAKINKNCIDVTVAAPHADRDELAAIEARLDQITDERSHLPTDDARQLVKQQGRLDRERTKLETELNKILETPETKRISLFDCLIKLIPQYDRVEWRPDWGSGTAPDDRSFNLFRGYAVEQYLEEYPDRDPDIIKPVTEHIHIVLCNRNDKAYEYFMDWLAHLCQHPSKRPGTAQVFVSRQGVGKDEFKEFLQEIIGTEHVVTVMDDHQFTGGFNAHMTNKLLIVANEMGSCGAAYRASNMLKSKISDSREIVTYKGVDSQQVRAYAGTMMFTQHAQPVHVESDDRRFSIVECNNDLANQPAYFRKLRQSFTSRAVQVEFYRTLRDRDLSNRHFASSIPESDLRVESKLASRPFLAQYLSVVAEHDEESIFVSEFFGLPGQVTHNELLRNVHEYMKKSGRADKIGYVTDVTLGQDMRRMFPPAVLDSMKVNRMKGRSRSGVVWHFPSAEELKLALAANMAERRVMDEKEVEAYMDDARASLKRKATDEPAQQPSLKKMNIRAYYHK